MNEYNLLIVCFISMIGIIIKAEWVEIPQFSHDKKIYRTSFKLDRFNQFSHNVREEFTSTVRYNIQNTSEFQQASEIKKTGYQKRPDSSFMGNATISSLDSSGYFQGTAVTVTNSENINLEENEESLGNYYYDEYKVEDEVHDKQIITPKTSEKEELLYTTCTPGILETKLLSNNSSHYQEKENINKSKTETEKHFLYYLPIKLLKRVHLILKAQPATLKGKIRFLKNFEKSLLSEVESRLATTILPLTNVNKNKRIRKRRHEHHEDDSMGFPSLEGALMAISFLTFAVYLVRLIMLLFQNFNNIPATAATVFLGRKKRSVDHLNEDMIRILSYLNK